MQDVLSRIIDDFHERSLPDLIPRERSITKVPGKAGVIVGMRRSGKTWFCYQRMQEVLSQGIEKERLLYLNFEDERLLPFTASDFQLILDTYYRKFPASKDRECFLFLDELQRIEGWDKFLRRVLDTEQLSVFVTGSSSKLLSAEIATALRGRSLTTEIFPFSFREFLRFHGVEAGAIKTFGSRRQATLQNMMDRYLRIGGFPEVQALDDDLRRQTLRNYVDVVILRDVIERHSITNVQAVRSLIRHCLSAPATRFSINKFYNTLRSQGIACTKNNLYGYLDHLSDAFFIYQARLCSRSESKRRANPRKVYAADHGLLSAMSLQTAEGRGALLENLVYMHLRRQGHHPEYYLTESGAEVDFAVRPSDVSRLELLQVCWDIRNEETWERERRALTEAMEELRVERGTVVTWLDEDTSDERIVVQPAWKWLLGDQT